MRKLLVGGLGLVFWYGLAAGQTSQQASNPNLSIGFPGEPWTLVFDAAGFKVNTNGLQPDGRAYLEAENQSTQVTLSVFLEKVPGAATDDGCKENQKARLAQKVSYEREKIETKEAAGMAIVEFTIPDFNGAPLQQRNVFACIPKGNVYIDIHLSKVLFKPQQQSLFDTVLGSVRFVDKTGPNPNAGESTPAGSAADATLAYFQDGSRYFIQQNFSAAIGPYQKALDAEKQSRTLTKDYWRILIDNLGMAYGITGDLNRAEDTFNYGVSQDPTYPMFYYNLACVSAGRNDMNATMEFLRKAFSYKANVIPTESMPDPRQDDSFKPFMSDQRFRDFLNSL
jgi:tetratricopeptide (TPR) repeat protein